MKKTISITLYFFYISIGLFSQNEDPSKLLAFTNKDHLDIYLKVYKWKIEENSFVDSLDGAYYLYSKKTSGGGNAYMAVYPKKFIHYMVFFESKKKYSKVLSYEEFLNMPEGKSRYNYCRENRLYPIKSISFDDPKETRNQNIYFGKTELKEGMKVLTVENIQELNKKQLKEIKKKEIMESTNEMINDIQQDEKLNEEDSLPQKK